MKNAHARWQDNFSFSYLFIFLTIFQLLLQWCKDGGARHTGLKSEWEVMKWRYLIQMLQGTFSMREKREHVRNLEENQGLQAGPCPHAEGLQTVEQEKWME